MSRYRVPDAREAAIIRLHGLDPEEFAVMHSDENNILLLHYKTRDFIEVRRGDKPW